MSAVDTMGDGDPLRRVTSTRDVTPEELLAAAGRMHRRLGRQLDLLDGGDAEAADELVASIRTTLCFGKGDRLLLRTVNVFGQTMPEVAVPEVNAPRSMRIVIGPLPEYPVVGVEGYETLPVPKWMETVAARTPQTGSRTWNRLIADYANTYGSHVSATIPTFLDEVSAFGVAGGTMGAHLIRSAAVVAEYGLGRVLADITGRDRPPLRDLHTAEVRIGFLGLTAEDDPLFSMSCTARRTVELFSMPAFNGKRLSGVWDFDEATGTGSMRLDWSESDRHPGSAATAPR